MFIAALFTIAKIWKQPKCPSIDNWLKKMWYIYIYIYIYTHCVCVYIYTMEYYSAIKIIEILPFPATWINLENIILSEVSQTERQILYDITYMWNLKINTNETICKTETDSQTENKLIVTKGESGGGGIN